jgi:hypothetical protein
MPFNMASSSGWHTTRCWFVLLSLLVELPHGVVNRLLAELLRPELGDREFVLVLRRIGVAFVAKDLVVILEGRAARVAPPTNIVAV